MQYRTLGRHTGLRVSELVLGTGNFGTAWGYGAERSAPRSVRLLIRNPLIMKSLVKLTPDAGSYVPVTVLVDERPDGLHLSYDTMKSFLELYGNAVVLDIARDLDTKIKSLLTMAAGIE